LADPVVELQRLNSGLTRQYVDSLFLANNPRTYVNMAAKVNIEDVISNRIGGIIRGEGPAGDAVAPIKTALVASESLQGLEMAQSMRERRTGVTRYNQGLDADSLNKTATGIAKIS
ncbi:portal protein, partial [Klebsiella pneumoniae]|uniref:portal protein n=1 Tax=Klebsiella pneumoniae TaxID=573 RepID=UPI001C5D112B